MEIQSLQEVMTNTVRLWDTTTGTLINTLKEHTSSVYSVAYNPDGNTIATGSIEVRLWDAKNRHTHKHTHRTHRLCL